MLSWTPHTAPSWLPGIAFEIPVVVFVKRHHLSLSLPYEGGKEEGKEGGREGGREKKPLLLMARLHCANA